MAIVKGNDLQQLRDPSNSLFAQASQGTRLTAWWAIPLLLLIFTLAGAPGGLIPLESAEESGLWRSTFETTAFLIAVYAPVVLLVFLWVWRREKRRPGSLGLQLPRMGRYLLTGFGFGIGLIGLGLLLMLSGGGVGLRFQQTSTLGWVAVLPALVVLAGWAVQGFAEEVMFRGWMLQNSGIQLGPATGVVFTTMLFALAHALNPGMTGLGALNLVLISILFALLALLEGGIWAASGFHIAWNWAQSNVAGFNVSGLEVGGGSIFEITPGTNATITGGEFGFEGSLAATTAIIIGILVVLAASGRVEGVA